MPTFALMKQEKETNSPSLHLQQQQLLLRMEYEYEKEEFRRQTETMGVARKVKRGMCWFPVTTGRSYYNSLNQLVLEVTRTEDTDIEHNFEYGRPVCFFRQTADGSLSYYNFQGTVSYADETRMVVVMPGAVPSLTYRQPTGWACSSTSTKPAIARCSKRWPTCSAPRATGWPNCATRYWAP